MFLSCRYEILLIGIVMAGRFLGSEAGQIQQTANLAKQALRRQAVPAELPEGAQAGIDDEANQFVKVVPADTETVWSKLFRIEVNADWKEPTLVVLRTVSPNRRMRQGQLSDGPVLLSRRPEKSTFHLRFYTLA